MIEKTLGDYIKRVQELDKKNRIAENRNVWNDPELAKQDIYYVHPEPASQDSDEKINPYSQH